MKVGIIGSRNLHIEDLGKYLPPDTDEIVSGGAKGIDTCARRYALLHGLKLTEFLPDYNRYGRGAPLKRNDLIIDYSEQVIAFWDGVSRGTKYGIDRCEKQGKKLTLILLP